MAVGSTMRPGRHEVLPRNRPPHPPGATRSRWSVWWPSLAVALPLLAYVVLIGQVEPWIWDYGQHAAVIDRLQHARAHPGNPLLDIPDGSSPYYTPFTVAAALAGRALGLTAFGTIKMCAVVNGAMLLSGVCRLTRLLSPSRWAPPVALLFTLFLWGPVGFLWAGFHNAFSLALNAGFPSCFALAMALHLWVGAARWARVPRPWLLLLMTPAAAVTLISHTIAGVGAALGCLAFLARPLLRLTAGQRLQLVAAGLVCTAMVVAWPYYNVLTLVGSDQLDHLHARVYKNVWGVYGFGALGLVALAGRLRRDALDPLAALAGAALLLVVHGYCTGAYTLSRMSVFAMIALQVALAVESVTWWRGTARTRLVVVVAVAACAVGMWAQSSPLVWLVPRGQRAVAERVLPEPYARWAHLDWAASRMRRGDVVAATAKPLNHLIPAYGMSLVSPAWPDPTLSTAEAAARYRALRTVFTPGAAPAARRQALARYEVRWILATREQTPLFSRMPGVVKAGEGPGGAALYAVE
ncbi:hypothetical protein [Streptomyces sp. NPDC049813]|uniref:hypothetical protein n=1 Tax=Streptomyces sp. NPDC049813 TaxID=3365597 RepID=UPI00379F6F63